MSVVAPINLPYPSLLLPTSASASSALDSVFSSSPTSLGLLLISELPPSFPSLRKNVLLQSNAFASMPDETKGKYEDRESSWSFGWSCGREKMDGDRLDWGKGSYYANPRTTRSPPGAKAQEVGGDERNIWPEESDCPGYQKAFEEMCDLVMDVGKLVAGRLDEMLVGEGLVGEKGRKLEELVRGSREIKARLLHYFPNKDQIFLLSPDLVPIRSTSLSDSDSQRQDEVRTLTSQDCSEGTGLPKTGGRTTEINDSWCGTHIDHSILTGLLPSLYLFHPTTKDGDPLEHLEPIVIPCPDSETGLYIKTRGGETVKAVIPENCLAFQTGETLQLLTRGKMAATPHFVHLSTSSSKLSSIAERIVRKRIEDDVQWKEVGGGRVSRETLAVFIQPNLDEVVGEDGETFAEFTRRALARHY